MKKKVIILLMISVMLCGCNKKDVSVEPSEAVESTEELGSEGSKSPHDRWNGDEFKVVSTPEPTAVPTIEPTIKPTTEPTVEPTSEPTAQSTTEPSVEPTEEPIKGAEERENLVNTYADIDLLSAEFDIEFEDYPWFILPEGASPLYYKTYQKIICAINVYFDGVVEDVYTCNIETDVVSEETNMVFQVRVHGEKSDLLVGLNGYEYTASVEEVVE